MAAADAVAVAATAVEVAEAAVITHEVLAAVAAALLATMDAPVAATATPPPVVLMAPFATTAAPLLRRLAACLVASRSNPRTISSLCSMYSSKLNGRSYMFRMMKILTATLPPEHRLHRLLDCLF